MLKVAIADDHALFRKSLKLLVGGFENMEIVVEAANGKELLDQLKNTPVDILLLDLQMPEMDGFETCAQLNKLYPHIKILILTLINEEDTIKRIMNMGVNGYFTKNTDPFELENAIWKLEDKGFYYEQSLSSIIEKILESEQENSKNLVETPVFTERELEIIRLAAKEWSGKEIADKLCVSLKTIEAHKRNIMDKTHSKNFIGVITYALSHQLLSFSELN
jgi:DNA-binding NarL/FixJ family response regulator